MKTRRITSLKDVKTLEVSLVERGANLKRRFHLMKARGETMGEILIEVLKAEGQSEAVQKLEGMLKEEMPEDAKAAILAAMKLLEAFSDIMPVGDALAALGGASGEEVEAAEEEPDEEDEAEKMEEEDDELKKTLDNLPPAAQAAIDAIWKDREELVAKSAELEKSLGEEIAKRSRREYLGKAEKTLCNIPGHSLDEVVDLMIEVKATNEELGARV